MAAGTAPAAVGSVVAEQTSIHPQETPICIAGAGWAPAAEAAYAAEGC